MTIFGVGAGGDSGIHSSLDEGRIAMDLGIVLHFRVLGQLTVCFVTIPELAGGLESAARLEGCLGDILYAVFFFLEEFCGTEISFATYCCVCSFLTIWVNFTGRKKTPGRRV
jgi:hypothetical protein